MRVLVLVANPTERGTWFRAREIARGLWNRGHEVTFVCTGEGYYRPREIAREMGWHEWGSASWQPLHRVEGNSTLGLLHRIVRLAGKWDFVYTFSHHPVDQGVARFLRRFGGFWMTDWCDLWSSTRGGILDRKLWADPSPPMTKGISGIRLRGEYWLEDVCEISAPMDADATSIIVSPMREETRRLGIPDRKVLHLVSGADSETIKPLDKAECRRVLELPHDPIIVGYVANFTPDNKLLIDAMKRVWRKRRDIRMISVGPKWYEDNDTIGRGIKRGKMIDFGRRPFGEVPLFLGASDFLVMPMRDVPFNRCRWPNKFGDYLAAGRATATNAVGDITPVINRWQTGIASPPTSRGHSDAILYLAENRVEAQQMGGNARRIAEEHLTWPSRIERLCRFLSRHGLKL
ncbi:MAG: hypothetical protein JJU11_09255 [Candidatus Sumerlaeia bacterium]|nr:hypothetical protein [Candidatus Sumerlaeia bacterium]